MLKFLQSRSCWRLLYLILGILIPSSAAAWEGTLWDVVDGDTLTALPAGIDSSVGAVVGIRLYGIEAPELHQPGGAESKASLASMVKRGDWVNIIPIESDRYDRSVALVIHNHVILNMEQVRRGHAFVSEKYCRARFCKEWKSLDIPTSTP